MTAKTLDGAIEEFAKNSIDIDMDGSLTRKARNSRDNLVHNIISLASDPQNKVPILYKGMESLKYGSFARSTKIKPIDDIDIMICFSGQGGEYDSLNPSMYHKIKNDKRPNDLVAFLETDNILNSTKLLNALKSSLEHVDDYDKAEIHRRKEAVTLKLKSYPWNFDIVPCFYTVNNYYLIPDGNGNWKSTDPRIDQNRLTAINQKHNGTIIPIIRIMKYWKREHLGKYEAKMSSYMFETMILDYYSSVATIHDSVSRNLCFLLQHLENAIKKPVNDPKGFQGDLNELNKDERNDVSSIFYESRTILNGLIIMEMRGNQTGAISNLNKFL